MNLPRLRNWVRSVIFAATDPGRSSGPLVGSIGRHFRHICHDLSLGSFRNFASTILFGYTSVNTVRRDRVPHNLTYHSFSQLGVTVHGFIRLGA
jgi:hypothetical protein